MIDSIGSTATAPAIQPTRVEPPQQAAFDTPPREVVQQAPVATQSAESAASARLGDQLEADADSARVQRAIDESAVSEPSGDTQASAQASSGAAAPAAGTAPAAGAGGTAASSSSESTDTDYIAEADTNSDKVVSDEERAVYEARLRDQAEKSAVNTGEAVDQTTSVRAAYGQATETASSLDITA